MKTSERVNPEYDKTDSRMVKLETQLDDFQHDLDWFGLIVAVVGIGFGALITVIVVFFALRTERSAIASAKDEIRGSKAEIDAHVAEVTAAAASIDKSVREIESHRKSVLSHSEEIEAGADKLKKILEKAELSSGVMTGSSEPSKLTHDEKAVLSAAAFDLHEKPINQLTWSEFRVLITESTQNKEWKKVIELARAGRAIHNNELNSASSLLSEMMAQSKLLKYDQSIDVGKDIIEQFSQSDDEKLRYYVDAAVYNTGLAYSRKGDRKNALMYYGRVIDGYEKRATSERALPIIARAYCNRGILRKRDNLESSLSDFDESIKISGAGRNKELTEPAIQSRLAKARALKDLNRFEEATKVLSSLVRIPHGNVENLKSSISKGKELLRELKERPDA